MQVDHRGGRRAPKAQHELVTTLSQIAPGAVLASNTSSIPITAIGRAAVDPARVVGLHFFNRRR
jgi:3-hydroxybutyryl-CoA dehydrogenase